MKWEEFREELYKIDSYWKVWFIAIIPNLLNLCAKYVVQKWGVERSEQLSALLWAAKRGHYLVGFGAPYFQLVPDPVEVCICCKWEKLELGLNQQVGTFCQFSASGAGSHESQAEEGVSLLHALSWLKHSKWSNPGCSINLCSTKEQPAGNGYLLFKPSHLCGWRKLAKPNTFLSLF